MPEIFSTLNPELVAVSLPTWVDLASVIVGSAGGVLVARARHLDAVGFVGLALLCGLGGGLVRDVHKLLASYEQVASITVYPTEFEKTPKRSIKRYLYNTALLEK